MKISKTTKILWGSVLVYFIISVLLGVFSSPLGLIMAENLGSVLFGALVVQFIIYTVNKFISGYKGD